MKRFLRLILPGIAVWSLPLVTSAQQGQKSAYHAWVESLTDRFVPVRETLLLEYDVTYRILFIKLMNVACARVETTEGLWSGQGLNAGTANPVYFVRVRIRSHNADEPEPGGMFYMDDTILAVVTRDDLNALIYVKRTRESMRPMLGPRKQADALTVYDLEHGDVRVCREDYLAGTVQTNLAGIPDLTAQGHRIAAILKKISAIYHGREAHISHDSDFRVYADVDGKGTPFTVRTTLTRAPLSLWDHNWHVIRAEVRPAPDVGHSKARDFTLWAVSLSDMADASGNTALQDTAAISPSWSMTPMVLDYELALGYIRCSLRTVRTYPYQEH